MAEAPVSGADHGVVLDLGSGAGALVLLADAARCGEEVEIARHGAGRRTHAYVLARSTAAGKLHAVVFGGLIPGRYTVFDQPDRELAATVDEARVTTVDLRTAAGPSV